MAVSHFNHNTPEMRKNTIYFEQLLISGNIFHTVLMRGFSERESRMLSGQCACITLYNSVFHLYTTQHFPFFPAFEEGATFNISIIQRITESQTVLGWKGPTRRKEAENEALLFKLSTILAHCL